MEWRGVCVKACSRREWYEKRRYRSELKMCQTMMMLLLMPVVAISVGWFEAAVLALIPLEALEVCLDSPWMCLDDLEMRKKKPRSPTPYSATF